MPYVFTSRYLIGRTPWIIERFLVGRVCQQYGRPQGMPMGSTIYAQRQQEITVWGPWISYEAAVAEFTSLGLQMWDYQADILDGGTAPEYGQYVLEQPAPDGPTPPVPNGPPGGNGCVTPLLVV